MAQNIFNLGKNLNTKINYKIRDINAAVNIRNAGVGSFGGPVESSRLWEAMKQEKVSVTN